MPDRTTAIAAAFEISLLLVGLVVVWQVALSPAARRGPVVALLPRWDAPLGDFVLFIWLICAGGFALSLGAGLIVREYSPGADATAVLGTAAGQLGILSGIAAFKLFFDRTKSPPVTPAPSIFVTGLATFAIAMPLVTATSLVWQGLLKLAGFPVEKQDLVRMFLEAESPVLLGTMIVLACVGAPLTEELVFRAGVFRYARTRLPRWLTLLLPAVLFAALHRDLTSFAPLVTLGILFSLAYERTGRIGTTILAHALFNLNSVVLIIAKVDI